MGPVDFAMHLLGFLAPALALAAGLALGARLLGIDRSARALWVPVALNFIAGAAVLCAGLWWFGRDGKMATYGVLVVVVASTQWLAGRRRGLG